MTKQYEPNYQLLHYISYTTGNHGNYTTTERQINARDFYSFKFPKECISFELFDKISRQSDQDETIFIGEILNREQFFIGKEYTLESVAKELGPNSPIFREIVADNPAKIVKIAGGEFLNISSEDKIITPSLLQFSDCFVDLTSQKNTGMERS